MAEAGVHEVQVHLVDAFTEERFKGNGAGVVTNAYGLSSDEMQGIAQELKQSETAFVLPPTDDKKADVRLQYITCTGVEVDFCGHATVAAFVQLAMSNVNGLGAPGEHTVRVETKAGIVPLTITNEPDSPPKVTFTAPQVNLVPYRLQGPEFADAFGVPHELIADSVIFLDTKLNYVYVRAASLRALGAQVLNLAHVRSNLAEEPGGSKPIVVFTMYTDETIDPASQLHARTFGPNIGILEDPFTGSTQAGLTGAAERTGALAVGWTQAVTEQGDFMGRPGRAVVTRTSDGRTHVTATAVPVLSATLQFSRPRRSAHSGPETLQDGA